MRALDLGASGFIPKSSPREVMVNAKGPGRTTLIVWETGVEPARYDVEVGKDTSEWDAFKKQIEENAVDSKVTVSGSGETIVLTGQEDRYHVLAEFVRVLF